MSNDQPWNRSFTIFMEVEHDGDYFDDDLNRPMLDCQIRISHNHEPSEEEPLIVMYPFTSEESAFEAGRQVIDHLVDVLEDYVNTNRSTIKRNVYEGKLL